MLLEQKTQATTPAFVGVAAYIDAAAADLLAGPCILDDEVDVEDEVAHLLHPSVSHERGIRLLRYWQFASVAVPDVDGGRTEGGCRFGDIDELILPGFLQCIGELGIKPAEPRRLLGRCRRR